MCAHNTHCTKLYIINAQSISKLQINDVIYQKNTNWSQQDAKPMNQANKINRPQQHKYESQKNNIRRGINIPTSKPMSEIIVLPQHIK